MRLGNKITNPGELNTLITLQSATISKDAGGAQKPIWTDLTPPSVWARWKNAYGPEMIAAQAVQGQALATVMIRYRPDVNIGVSILKGTDRWEIISVDDIEDRHEYMELSVRFTKGSL